MRATNGRRFLANATLFFASVMLSIALLEVGLRGFWDGYYLKQPKVYHATDPIRGWKNRPNVSLDYGDPEFSTVVTHNQWGYRSQGVDQPRTSGRSRVLVLGDSFTYGIGVQNDETFSALLQKFVPRREVINTGVSGYGTSHQLVLLRDEGLAFRPDLIIVASFGNDLSDSYKGEFAQFKVSNGELTYPDPVSDERLMEFESTRRGKGRSRSVLRYSYAYRFLSDRIKLARKLFRETFEISEDSPRLKTPEETRAAWELMELLIEEIGRLSRETEAKILIVVIPYLQQVQSGPRLVGGPADLYQFQAELLKIAKRSEIPSLDLLPVLRAAHQREGIPLYYPRDGHLTRRGHELAAEAIEAEIQRLGLLPVAGSENDTSPR